MQTEKHAAANQKPQNFLLAPENLTPTWFQCDGCHSHPSICLFHCRHYFFLNSPQSFIFFMSHTLTNNIVTITSPLAGTGIFRDFSLCQLQRNVSDVVYNLIPYLFLPYMTLCSFNLSCIYILTQKSLMHIRLLLIMYDPHAFIFLNKSHMLIQAAFI